MLWGFHPACLRTRHAGNIQDSEWCRGEGSKMESFAKGEKEQSHSVEINHVITHLINQTAFLSELLYP